MALINCPECNREVSNKAETCPNCGFGVAKFIEKQNKILKIQEDTEKEAYLYVKRIKKEEKEKLEREKQGEIDRKNKIYNDAVSKYKAESSKDVESAEKLLLSISEWRDSKEYLDKCKNRISELKQRELMREENRKRRNRKNTCIMVSIVACIGLICGGYLYYEKIFVPSNIYKSAMNSLQNGNYEEAIEKLETITEYKDTVQQIEIATGKKFERDHSNAKELIEENKYTEALEILKKLENSGDVSDLIIICENSIQYDKAISLAESENYRDAIVILEKLGDFKDSTKILEEYRLEADYLEAINDINYGIYKNAYSLLKNLGDYKDSKEKYNELCYQLGMREFEEHNYTEAERYLGQIVDIKDVSDIMNECEVQLSYEAIYSSAKDSISSSNLDEAVDLLKQLPSDYRDVTNMIDLCNKYKNIVGNWKCIGYDGSNNRWITDRSACREHDFIVKVDSNGNLSLAYYKFDYKNLEYTGTVLKWEASFMTHTLNISTGILTYSSYKESYVHVNE